MARNKEALVLLLDVGPSMHGVLQQVENVCSTLVLKKLVYNRSDEIGVVLFGTKETCNELAKELGGYKHVVVARDIKVVDEETTHALQNLPRGTSPGDFLDAIVVGLDMLIRKFGNMKGKQRMCLITDAQHPLRDPPQGTKKEQVDTIADQMKKHEMKMDCIVFRESGVLHNAVMDENDQLLYHFRERSVAKVVQVDSPTSLLGALRTRNILPVTVFRGDLEVSSNFKIKVWVYKKTSEEKFPSLKKYSDKAPASDKFATHEVKVDYEYKSVLEPDTVVPPDQRIKGYLYGPQVVPISSAEWEAVKFKPEKGVKLLGFTDRSSIFRHYFMKDVFSFVPEPGNRKAAVAVSALARAMSEMDKVGILRCVWRQGQGNVALGVLTPNISSVRNVPDSFYFNILPFAEDIREFQFRSFSSLPASSQPTEEQQEAADNLVKMLDLAPPGREEILKPDFTPNPMLERFYSFLDLKSKQPDANVPPLNKCLKRITEPVIDYQAPLIKKLGNAFELKENPKKKKARTQDRLTYTGADDQTKSLDELSAEKAGVLEALYPPKEKVGGIGDHSPVQDFEAMLSQRSSSAWVQKAIEEMQKYITALIQDSPDGDYHRKALECLAALRKACIIEQEPKEYNGFLTKLCQEFRAVDDAKFFQLLLSKNASLISKEEAPDSDVTEEMARNFCLKSEPSSQ
ncbi:ATP-dependent DNA helicase 2 subunit KU80 [Oryza brachyantha]|uniref:ATP-dependent DNA helicase 2 subunit KU80 n=1 Tax=Oryza brachyantha TaxID=4533 RepID=J3LUY2_ORYBR|nr:ATP-dependent DNA helicase 2 subunit KU80 [Oryza brachyantha]